MTIADPLRNSSGYSPVELQKDDIKLILGGGYGLVLKTEYIRQAQVQTRFDEIPLARSTNDLDLFLSAEIITSIEKIEKVRDAIGDLDFKPYAEYFQFILPVQYERLERPIKIDLLAALPKDETARRLVKINKPRIKPKGAHNIHGYLTAEAVTLEENLLPVNILDNAEPLEVYLPHPFSSLVMKLFALRDLLEDEEKIMALYHAFDIYRIIAMMTEQEWEESLDLYEKYKEETKIREAAEITERLFETAESIGILRVRQHARTAGFQISSENLDSLIEDLREIFGSK